MELSDGFVRVIGRHLLLIVLLTALGIAGGAWLHLGDAKQYRATVRFSLDLGDPSTAAQSTVIADTARALATSSSLITGALHEVGTTGDPVQLAQHGVTVSSLGSSGVLAVTVRNSDARVAEELAQQIAKDVIAQHNKITNGRYDSTAKALDAQIASTKHAISSIDNDIKTSSIAFAGPVPLGTPPLSERPWTLPEQLLRQRADLVQTLGALTSARANVGVSQSSHAEGTVIDTAVPAIRVAGRLVPDAALGGLLGLVAGIALAALLEMFRPTLVGRDALARNLGAPVLAEVRDAASAEADIAEAAMHIELAAVAADVQRVGLLAMRPAQELHSMADLLGSAVRGLDLSVIARSGSPGPSGDTGVPAGTKPGPERETGAAPPAPGGTTGVVLVTPRVVRVTELNRVVEFFTISGWPLLGLIVVRGRGALPRRLTRTPAAAEAPLLGTRR